MASTSLQFICLKTKKRLTSTLESHVHSRKLKEMSEQKIAGFLREFGLAKRETDVYVFLSRKGPQKVNEVSAGLRIDRSEVYRILANLQKKGVIESSFEYPARYMPIALNTLIDSLIDSKKGEIGNLESRKEDLMASWSSIKKKSETSVPITRFSIVMGRRRIQSKILQIVKETKKELLMLTTGPGVIHSDISGVFDEIVVLASKRNIGCRILTDISQTNIDIIKAAIRKAKHKKLDIKFRHVDLTSDLFSQYVIRDRDEVMLHSTTGDTASPSQEQEKGFWIKDEIFVSVLNASFEEKWRNAIDAADKMDAIESGRPVEVTQVLRDAEKAQERILEVLGKASDEVLVITSSQGLRGIMREGLLTQCHERKIKCKVMAPIDLDNLEEAQRLSKSCEIKHISISYLMMLLVDRKHLFVFKTQPVDEEAKHVFYMTNVFYTNDQRYVERAEEMLKDIWKRGVDLSDIASSAGMKMPSVRVSSDATLFKTAEEMLRNNADSALIMKADKPIGITLQRDILREIVRAQKDPHKTYAEQAMSVRIVAVDNEESLTQVIKTLKEKGMERTAVLKDGKLVAMIT